MEHNIQYLTKVEIWGLWGRFDIVWDLNSDVNVLAGINGSGKSTILDCICGLLLRGRIADYQLGMIDKVKLSFNNEENLSYEFFKVKDSIKNIEEEAKNGDLICKRIITRIKEREGKDYNNSQEISFEAHETSFQELELTLEEINELIQIDIISTFDNSLKQSEAVRKLSDDLVETELDWEIYHLQKKYLDYQLNISKRKDALIIETNGDNLKDNLRDELIKIKYPQVRFLEILNHLFSETGKQINKNKNQIEFLLGEKELSAYQLSSGEKQLLIILLTALIQDNKSAILFMDEPEISLHMDWQEKLIKYIRELNPNAQLIIATHSPAIIMDGWLDRISELSDLIVHDKEK